MIFLPTVGVLKLKFLFQIPESVRAFLWIDFGRQRDFKSPHRMMSPFLLKCNQIMPLLRDAVMHFCCSRIPSERILLLFENRRQHHFLILSQNLPSYPGGQEHRKEPSDASIEIQVAPF